MTSGISFRISYLSLGTFRSGGVPSCSLQVAIRLTRVTTITCIPRRNGMAMWLHPAWTRICNSSSLSSFLTESLAVWFGWVSVSPGCFRLCSVIVGRTSRSLAPQVCQGCKGVLKGFLSMFSPASRMCPPWLVPSGISTRICILVRLRLHSYQYCAEG